MGAYSPSTPSSARHINRRTSPQSAAQQSPAENFSVLFLFVLLLFFPSSSLTEPGVPRRGAPGRRRGRDAPHHGGHRRGDQAAAAAGRARRPPRRIPCTRRSIARVIRFTFAIVRDRAG